MSMNANHHANNSQIRVFSPQIPFPNARFLERTDQQRLLSEVMEDATCPNELLLFLPKPIPLAVFSIQSMATPYSQLVAQAHGESFILLSFTSHVQFIRKPCWLVLRHLQHPATLHYLHHEGLGWGHCPLPPGLLQLPLTSLPAAVPVPLRAILSKGAGVTF